MKIEKICTGILAALLIAAAATAEEKTLTIDQAVQSALDGNLDIQQQKITLNALKRASACSWNSISPTLTASGSVSIPNDQSGSTYTDTRSIGGTVSATLSPSLYSSMKTAYLNYENGKLTYSEAVRSIELSVRTTFYNLLYQKENIALQQRNLETARQQYEQNKVKYQSGQASELDMLTSQVSYEKLKPTLQSAQITYDSSIASFKQVLGIDQGDSVALSGSLDDVLQLKDINPDTDPSSTPGVQAAENSVKIAESGLLATRFSAWGPKVSATWTYNKVETMYKSTDPAYSTTGSLTLGVSIPLDGYLPWSTGAQSVATSKDSVETAKLKLADKKTAVSVDISNYTNQIKQEQAQIESLKANIDLAQKSYDMTLAAYNHGSKDLLSLQTAADSLLSAKVSLASQEYTLMSAVLNLESVLGVPFGSLGK